MAFGFVAKNDAGQTLIDDQYTNLALISKGTTTCTLSGGFTTIRRATLSFSGRTNPVLAIRPTGVGNINYVTFMVDKTAADTFLFTAGMHTSGNLTFDWWLFDNGVPPAVSGYGLKVNKASGNTAWHSDWKVMRAVNVQEVPSNVQDMGTYDAYGGDPVSFTGPSSGTYAVAFSAVRSWSPGADEWYTDLLYRTAANDFTVSETFLFAYANLINGDDSVHCTEGGIAMLIDVTGY